jgi:glutamine amidotransferase
MIKTVCIIDYGSGNLRSAARAFERVIAEEGLDFSVLVSSEASDLARASHIVLPGQGAFGDCMRGLNALPGMRVALEEQIIHKGKPFLGICVGMQLLATRGFEGGVHEGLGWIEGDVNLMQPADISLKIPHMGWNDITITQEGARHPVLKNLSSGDHVYFVHSYVFETKNAAHNLALSEYGGMIPAIVGRDNILGAQFHPEKSQAAGLKLLSSFLSWSP